MARGWGAATGGNRANPRGPADYFKPGDWNARCGTCNRKCKASQMIKLAVFDLGPWFVCPECYEMPNPQNFVRGIPDRQNVPWVQNPPDVMIGTSTSTGQVPGNGGNMVGGPMVGGPMAG
jgi:hypothetical protein